MGKNGERTRAAFILLPPAPDAPRQYPKPRRDLTQLELDLLYYFSRNPRRVLTREELLERVWHLHNSPNTRSVDNFIVRLRKYFEPRPEKPVFFVSHRGAGYKFVPDGGRDGGNS